ncbi:hypothetical protein CERSUDRAFT_118120 [Gelatoporia subvermispora B]|uniref:Uncharacterized protein n=1 Tax=Ceriporiopsis subvermispora (strain B) TaxID=914234 RepID=M2Q887_CERS8|nr:hypothetical protein CERSUDRAFT_118120 [Gelatoporia subvermispora B]
MEIELNFFYFAGEHTRCALRVRGLSRWRTGMSTTCGLAQQDLAVPSRVFRAHMRRAWRARRASVCSPLRTREVFASRAFENEDLISAPDGLWYSPWATSYVASSKYSHPHALARLRPHRTSALTTSPLRPRLQTSGAAPPSVDIDINSRHHLSPQKAHGPRSRPHSRGHMHTATRSRRPSSMSRCRRGHRREAPAPRNLSLSQRSALIGTRDSRLRALRKPDGGLYGWFLLRLAPSRARVWYVDIVNAHDGADSGRASSPAPAPARFGLRRPEVQRSDSNNVLAGGSGG